MGYDQHERSNSSGALVAVLVAVMLFVVLGILAVAGAGLFLVKDSRQRSQAVVFEQQLFDEVRESEAVIQQSSSTPHTSDASLNFGMIIDSEGNASVDGENIDLDQLRSQLVKLKDETSNTFSLHINADAECPIKHIIPVLDVCQEVGDIDFRIVSATDSDVRITATVVSYELAAEWDHFDDGTFSAYDKMTLNVVAPEPHGGTTLSLAVPPTKLPEDSAFRTAGTRLTFTLQASDLKSDKLAWGAIDDPTIVQ